ncbi:peptide/nickel transport system ATP-binding protein [Variovorax sp. GrIS 2.14]|uniref:ABC transporter ATP-binding protein n=1 Tax=Variovorax sp. GrIS 2.14 TaxID=3071709 RepID=UPI0038F7150A
MKRIDSKAGETLLEVDGLRTRFDTLDGPAHSVDGISYTVRAGQTLGVVGESGCGKSVTALSIMRLLGTPLARISGSVRLRGVDLLTLSERDMRRIRGNRISMVFQDPMTSLNPVLSVGRQIAETVRVHQALDAKAAWARAVEMLHTVQIPEPERRAGEFPHQLSGGMRQRVMIAMALACNPEVLIADEPTTALDVTVQAQILALIKRLQQERGMGVVMITHDLGVVAESCDDVVVMYAGRKVEEGPVAEIFARPLHPYTRALMASMPAMSGNARRLNEIPGLVPSPLEPRVGCSFAPRCPHAAQRCRVEIPVKSEQGHGQGVACFAVEEGRIGMTSQAPMAQLA